MPRVFRKRKSRAGRERSCGHCGRTIQPGEEYLQWSFRYGGTRYRCTEHPPRPSDLTQSKMSQVYSAIEGAEDSLLSADSADAIRELVSDVAEATREVADEYEEAAEPFGNQGENQERAEDLGSWADELESFELAVDEDDEEFDLEDARQEARDAIGECPL